MNILLILSWNCNGIETKLPELATFIKNHKIDIILLGETRLSIKHQLSLPNFYTYRTDRTSAPRKPTTGDTAILVRRNIVHQHINIKSLIGSTTIKFKLNNNIVQISAVYKSPRDKLQHQDLNVLTNHNGPFIIAGNLNAKHTVWNSRRTNTAGTILLHHMESTDLYAAPDSPTYYSFNAVHQPDVLVILLLNLQPQKYSFNNISDLSSDHNPIILSICDSPVTNSSPRSRTKTNWKKFTLEMARITQIPYISTKTDIDREIEKITTNIQQAIK